MRTRFQKAVALITASALLLSTVTGIGIWQQGRGAKAMNVVLENPDIQEDDTMLAGQKVTWDCVYFGSYPQAEVVSSEGEYSALDASLYDADMDILSDSALYAKLENAEEEDWQDNELVLDGVKYRRMLNKDTNGHPAFAAYKWGDMTTYHYFKYEDIKWRVLSTDGEQALLLSDIGLDSPIIGSEDSIWGNCVMRSWLNGYAATQNGDGSNYTGQGFVNRAFNQNEAEAIMEAELTNEPEAEDTTQDKVFLLSREEAYTKAYGFKEDSPTDNRDEARKSYCSTYAKAMGVSLADSIDILYGADVKNCGQALRGNHFNNNELLYDYITRLGTVGAAFKSSIQYKCHAIRPALYLDLSKTDQYEYAGTVCSDGTVVDAQTAAVGKATLPPAEASTGAGAQTPSGAGAQTPSAAGTQTPSEPPTSASPSAKPSASPSTDPSASPSAKPSASSSANPSASPSADPSASPSADPSASPSAGPSAKPSADPSASPSADPSASPSEDPSASPSVDPSADPSAIPSVKPSVAPTESPTPGEIDVIEKTVYRSKYFTDEETMGVYKITKLGDNGTVVYIRPTDKTQKSVTIPDTVEYRDNTYRVVAIGEHAFYKNKKIQRITLGENVTKIANRAFYKCTNLRKINFNRKLKRIGTKAFFRCNSLEKIVLPAKVEHIGVRAFYKCKNLKTVVLSKNMLEIGTKSFYQCKKLSLDMKKVKRKHIAIGRKPFSGVKQVKYGNVKSRPSK